MNYIKNIEALTKDSDALTCMFRAETIGCDCIVMNAHTEELVGNLILKCLYSTRIYVDNIIGSVPLSKDQMESIYKIDNTRALEVGSPTIYIYGCPVAISEAFRDNEVLFAFRFGECDDEQ